eukprot:9808-Pyramimonas_sp.AAC.1
MPSPDRIVIAFPIGSHWAPSRLRCRPPKEGGSVLKWRGPSQKYTGPSQRVDRALPKVDGIRPTSR